MGHPKVFSQEEETIFKKHVMALSDIGLPISKTDLPFIIQNYLNTKKPMAHIFKNNMPGWDWGEQFLDRHPNKAVFGQNISRKRVQVNFERLAHFLIT